MEVTATVRVKIWGARGSRAVPGENTLIYGGNTACVEVQCGEHSIILDAGSGICELMTELNARGKRICADLFFSHVHWDHVLGLPFFYPLYQPDNVFRIHGLSLTPYDFETLLRNIMQPPYFPVSFDSLKSRKVIVTHSIETRFNLQDGWLELTDSRYSIPEVWVETHANQHPNGGGIYKFSHAGSTVCYASDTECNPDDPAFIESLIRFVYRCDLLIMDANYTRDEYVGHIPGVHSRGWGHACWEDCVMVAKRAEVKRLCLFHHDAARTDQEQAQIEKMAQQEFPMTIAAREGLEWIL